METHSAEIKVILFVALEALKNPCDVDVVKEASTLMMQQQIQFLRDVSTIFNETLQRKDTEEFEAELIPVVDLFPLSVNMMNLVLAALDQIRETFEHKLATSDYKQLLGSKFFKIPNDVLMKKYVIL